MAIDPVITKRMYDIRVHVFCGAILFAFGPLNSQHLASVACLTTHEECGALCLVEHIQSSVVNDRSTADGDLDNSKGDLDSSG